MKKWNRSFEMAPVPERLPLAEPLASLEFLFNSRPWIMGVLNVTPDSFYTGSRVPCAETAMAQAELFIRDGAECLDVGGESTRPGSEPVSVEAELSRVIPVLEAIHQRWPAVPISVDTQKAKVAYEAIQRGARFINDVSAFRADPAMAEVVAPAGVPVVLMHMKGTPQTMQQEPRYGDVVSDLKAFFEERLAFAAKQGISESRILLDPGIGFGKTVEHNVALLRRLRELMVFGRPILVGLSRKMFLGRLAAAGDELLPPEQRLEATVAANLFAVEQGARGLRVHDVGAMRKALNVWQVLATK